MAKKDKKEVNYYYEPVVVDEMQKAVSFELEHRSLRLWYVLNSIAMWVTMVVFACSDSPAAIPNPLQVMLLIHYGIMYFCLSLYNLRAADKGVLDSFSPFQKGSNGGLLYLVSFINIFAPTQPIITYLMEKGDNVEVIRSYLTFFIVWACMAWLYYIIASYSVYLNKKVRDSIAADDEETEEE